MNLKHARIANVSQHAAANALEPRGQAPFTLTAIVSRQVALYSRKGDHTGVRGRLGVVCRSCFMRVPNLHNHCCPTGHAL